MIMNSLLSMATIMKTLRILPVISLATAALLASALAHSQQSTDTSKTPPQQQSQQQAQDKKKQDQPPKLEKLEDSEPPSIKVGKPAPTQKITETSDNSGAKEVKVQTGGSTYYVHPDQQVGNSLPGDVQSVHNHGAEWKVFEFDLGSKARKSEKSDDTSATPPKDRSISDEPAKK